jgi:hypothetical protein
MQKLIKKYKYVKMVETEKKPKTSVFEVRTNSTDDILGEIRWHPQWRQYSFIPSQVKTIFSKSCMIDIIDFINVEMAKRNNKK